MSGHVRLHDDDEDGNGNDDGSGLAGTHTAQPAAADAGAASASARRSCQPSCSLELASVVLVGSGFLVIFSAFNTAQDYATQLLGRTLGNTSLCVLYLTFIGALLVSPRLSLMVGHKASLVGGGMCYAIFMVAQYAYFRTGGAAGHTAMLVVGAAALNGVGASMIWTAQGNLMSSVSDDSNRGTHAGLFWALFIGCFVVGNIGAAAFFGTDEVEAASENDADQTLFAAFALVVVAGLAVFLLLPSPAALAASKRRRHAPRRRLVARNGDGDDAERTARADGGSGTHDAGAATVVIPPHTTLWQEACATWRLMTRQPVLRCWSWFFLSGIINTYQQGAMPRFFHKADNGVAFAVFGAAEVIGALLCGRALDVCAWRTYLHATSALLLLSLVLATTVELIVPEDTKLGVTDAAALLPLVSLAVGGACDSAINVLIYALVGVWFPDGIDNSRAVAAYKCVQSLGFATGFAYGGVAGALKASAVATGLALIALNAGLTAVGVVWPPRLDRRPASEVELTAGGADGEAERGAAEVEMTGARRRDRES